MKSTTVLVDSGGPLGRGRDALGSRNSAGGLVSRPELPLVALFGGIPIWWALGLFQIAFIVFTIPMLVHLLRQRWVLVPNGFAIWLLLLAWVAGGILVLQVDAPGAVPGESPARYLTFALRMTWYLCATVAMLYVVNTERVLRTSRVAFAVGCMFLSLVAGGILALLSPTFEFTTPFEAILPGSLSGNGFVASMVHARVAQVQDILGSAEPRPSAPFAYANQWGVAIVVTAPMFVIGWWRQGGIYRKVVPIVLAVSLAPIVASLNRGMWAALLVMTAYALVRSGIFRRPILVIGAACVFAAVAAGVWAAGLATVVVNRLNTPHSNEGRSNLGQLTVRSTLEGSPIMGFGTTRDVQGNFSSIAGGASAICPGCSPAPLGTQGNLWELIFGAGFVGLFLYLLFMIHQLVRYSSATTPIAIAAQASIIGVLVTSPVYNLIHPILIAVMIILGILVREGSRGGYPTLAEVVLPIRRSVPIVLVVTVAGALAGGAIQAKTGVDAVATQRVLVSQADLLGVSARPLSLDSEALIATSQDVLVRASEISGVGVEELADGVSISVEPNTRVMIVRVAVPDASRAQAGSAAISEAYLEKRLAMARAARESLRERHEGELVRVGGAIATAQRAIAGARVRNPALLEEVARLRQLSVSTGAVLSGLEGELDPGTILAQPRIVIPLDPWVVSISSGLMVGLMLGLCTAWWVAGRFPVLHNVGRAELTTAVVGRIGVTKGQLLASDVERAARVLSIYEPLAAVLADPSDPRARRLAADLDSRLDPPQRSGRRALLVTCNRARVGSLERTTALAGRMNLDVVGLILIED